MHSREAALQSQPCIRLREQRRILRLPPAAHRLAMLVHVPVQMDVGVDPAGHHREASQIVRSLRLAGIDGADARPFDHNLPVLQRAALSIQHHTRLNDDGRLRYRHARPEN